MPVYSVFIGRQWTLLMSLETANGARGRNRTADTMIFSHVLYQLSYPGIAAASVLVAGERLEARLWRSWAGLASLNREVFWIIA